MTLSISVCHCAVYEDTGFYDYITTSEYKTDYRRDFNVVNPIIKMGIDQN